MISSNYLKVLILFGVSLINATEHVNDEPLSSAFFSTFVDSVGGPKVVEKEVEKVVFSPKLDETDADYWTKDAQHYLKDVLEDPEKQMKPRKAKNIILFMGDGMSLATVAATRMYLGGEEKQLSFEKFAHFGLSKTYCVDKQVADSACSSTAYLSGVKANYGTMGLSAKVALNDCEGQNNPAARTESIAKWAQGQCKATGFVTTSKATDASPGGLFSHIANRYWENDQMVLEDGCDPSKTIDIARQLVENEVSRKFKIVLAGGREEFRPASVVDEELKRGKRGDGKDLIKEWIDSRSKDGKTQYVYDKRGLDTLSNDTEYVLGLFDSGHCPYNVDIVEKKLPKPTLSEMTEVAVKHLLKRSNENGFFLFVEGARIDMAHHDNFARIALDETREFSKAIEITRNLTNEKDTLIVVTADHAHVMTYNGYQKRGSDILGLSDDKGLDNLPYTILSYANGIGFHHTYHKNGSRMDLSKYDLTNPRHRYPATVPLLSETHGGEDVGIYASGPESHLFIGNYEQSYIPILMAHASDIGPFATNEKCPASSSIAVLANASILLGLLSSLFLVMQIRD